MIPAISRYKFVPQNKIRLNRSEEKIGLISSNSLRESYGLSEGITYNTQVSKAKECYTPEEIFDIQYASATKISDGVKIIRPICLSLGKVDIEPTENPKEYKITIAQNKKYVGDNSTGTVEKIMSQEELLHNRKLVSGFIKQTGKNEYQMVYYNKEGEVKGFSGNKRQILNVLEENRFYL